MTDDLFLKYVCLFESEMRVGPETITGNFKNENLFTQARLVVAMVVVYHASDQKFNHQFI